MANQLGRISGQLLKDNLTRNDDLQFDTDLLYLNTGNRYISVNSTTTSKPLFVNGTLKTTDFIAPVGITGIASFKFDFANNTISAPDDINLFSSNYVYADRLQTSQLEFYNNVIQSLNTNTNIDLSPSGSGTVEVFSELNISGDLTATGNITLDGTITFGSDNNDSLTFTADINSDIIPDIHEYYSLGSNPTTGRWKEIYPSLINGQLITGLSIVSGGLDLVLRPGNIWYVAANGNDTNVGNHQSGPFATIGHALTEATSGDTVYIYPGTYNEFFPLTVPVGVTVKGSGIRAVTVVPDSTTQSETAFLLNGESTVSDLTVKDFYAPGYAFAFAPGFTVSSRSPYVQNITVITKGTTTSISDPRGFASGDAGGGARVDGSLATASSKEASMLFHSVTFICPGVDALVMTNGVRVEWLNSFSYFANRGLYATQGTLGLASLGIRFGAELRSIGSANVYGNYGAEANGASTLMYLVQHNFAYIGAGKDVTNDPSLNIAVNETVEIAAGKIYYQSLDNKGNFKVGDAFGVSFETGRVAINGVSVSAGGVTSINFASGTDETVIDATQININNIKFSGNTLSSLSGNVELTPSTNEFNMLTDVATSNNVDITGDFTTDGQLTIGNQFIDVIEFVAPLDYELRPNLHNSYSLGKFDKQWATTTVSESYLGNLKIQNNIIATLDSNANLELLANGTGKIVISNADAVFDQNLTVGSDTFLKDTNITGLFNYLGNLDQIGNTLQTGNRYITGNLTVIGDVDFGEVEIKGNTVATSTSNSNLELKTSGSGKVYVPSNDVQIDNNLTVNGVTTAGSVGVTTSVISQTYNNSNISIGTSVIETTVSNSDLELRASGTGRVYVPNDNVKINNNLTVDGTADLAVTTITGLLNHLGTITQTGDTAQLGNRSIIGQLTVSSNVDFGDIEFVNNRLLTTRSNSNLELTTSGTGQIYAPNNDVQIDNDLVIAGLTASNSLTSTTSVTGQTYSNSNISIGTNIIETTVSNSDLELRAAGTGRVYIPQDDVKIDQNLTVDGTTTLANTDITGLINHLGTTTRTGSTTQTGNASVTGNLTVIGNIDFGEINVNGNTITTSTSNSNLELTTSGNGEVYIPSNNVQIDNNLTVNGLTTAASIAVTALTTTQTYSNSNIFIGTNVIETTVSNSDLELRAAGTGRIYIPQDDVKIDNDLTVDGPTTTASIDITGLVNQTGSSLQTGNTLQTGNRTIAGRLTVNSNVDFGNITISGNTVSTSESNSNLELKTSGSGEVYVPSNDVQIDNDLVVADLTSSNSLTSTTSTTSQTYSNSNISIGTNVIEPTVSNSDLELRAAGTGRVYIPQDNVKIDNNLTVDGTTALANTSVTGLITHIGNTSQTGNILQTGNKTIIGRLTVTDNIDFGEIEIKGNTISTSTSNSNLELKTSGSGEVYVPSNDVQIDNDLVVAGLTSSNSLTSTTSTTSQTYSNSNISIGTNIIETTVSNSDLELRAAGTGRVYIPNDNVKIDNDLTVDGTTALANTSITGSITHAGNYNQTGSSTQTGNRTITGRLTVIGDVDFGDVEFKGNTITTTRSNSNLELSTSGSGQVIFNDAVLLNQSANITTLVTNGIGNSGTITSEIFTNTNIEIQDNNIKTTSLNSDLIISANNTGIVSFPLDPVVIGQDFTVTLSSTLKNTTIVGPLTHAGLTTQVGSNTQTGILDITGDLTVTADAYLENVNIINNRITTVASNSNLELKAVGSGIVRINDSAAFGQQLTVNGVTTTNNITSSGTITADQFKNDDILIDDNYITTTNSNSNLALSGEGIGGAKLEKIKFNSNTISTDTVNEGITLTIPFIGIIGAPPATEIFALETAELMLTEDSINLSLESPSVGGNLIINSPTALKVPVGTSLDRPTLTQSEFRFNTTDSLFRGFSSSKVSFAGVYSENLQTNVLAHPTNNTLLFTANNILAGTISSTGLVTNGLLVDNNLFFNNSVISSTTVNSDIVFLASGTGHVKIDDIAIEDNEFLNLNSTQPILLENTGDGYVKFAGTAGLTIPVGNNNNRPVDPETGDLRWNTQISTAEVFNGIEYQTLSGGGGDLLSAAEIQEVTNLWALVLG